MEGFDEIIKKQKEWENNTLKSWLDKYVERNIYSEIPKKRLYTPVDRVNSDYLLDLGFPGEYPFTRGLNPTEYRSRLWFMPEGAGFGTPEDTNRLYKLLLSKGSNRISTYVDLPTELGYDPDNPLAEGEVGVVGTSLPSLREMEILLDGIPISEVAIAGLRGHTAIITWSMVFALANKRRYESLVANIVADGLFEFFARGNYIFSPEGSRRLSTDLVEYTLKWKNVNYTIGNGYPIAEAGASLVQASALMLACGLIHIEDLLNRGLSIDDICPRVGFNAHVGLDFFEEIAKFRALRRLWAKIMREKYGAKKNSSLHFRFGPGTAGSLLTAQSPENNIARTTIAALAAVLSGAHSLQVSAFDEAYAIPTERSASIALATQQIIAYETGIPDVVDPMGGSYYIETLTDEIEQQVLDYLSCIDNNGGIIKAIESGWVQNEITRSAYSRQKQIDEGKRIVIGVNKSFSDEKPKYQIHEKDPAAEEDMKRRVNKLRAERENSAVQRSLKNLQSAAQGQGNLVPYVIDAVESYATIEEVTNALAAVFGRWQKPSTLDI